MFERIVVVSDDTPGCGILSFGAALARRCHARVEIVPLEYFVSAPVAAASDRHIWATERSAADGFQPPDLRSSLILASSGADPGPASVTEAGRLLIRRLLRSSREPILFLPSPSARLRWGSETRSPRFLVGLGQADRSSLDAVTMLAQAVDAHVTLATVIAPIDPKDAPQASRRGEPNHGVRVRFAQIQLDRLADRLRGNGVSVASIVLTSQDSGSALVDKFRHGYDLLVVGCPGSIGDDELGPVADAATAQTEKPVLLVPQDFEQKSRIPGDRYDF